jgi:ornithine cyclodeaminase/alanine dehydrogenase-like protein (mu-crystallin family)
LGCRDRQLAGVEDHNSRNGQHQLIVLGHQDVERLLPMRDCIAIMEQAFGDLQRGFLHHPLRTFWAPPGVNGVTVWMPAYRSSPKPMFGTKLLFVLNDNPSRGLDSHQGQVILADGETGQLRGILDASAVTAIRTAAVSALATKLLAREDANALAIIGTGVQARTHLESIPLVRRIKRVLVVGRTAVAARRFVDEAAERTSCDLTLAESAEQAVRLADIVVTATSSPRPVLDREWLRPGTHVNAVGASRPIHCEIDPRIYAEAVAFCDRRESLRAEAGDYLQADEQRFITGADRVGELGELVAGERKGRTSDDQITLFRSLGLAIEDLAAAEFVLARAERSA